MATEAQLLANRLNALKSIGPRTPRPTPLSHTTVSNSASLPSAKQLAHPAGPTNHNLIIMQNKANFRKAAMFLTFYSKRDYENEMRLRTPENKPNQTQFQARRLPTLFLFFTSLYPSYNLPMQNWTIQNLLNWITEHFAEKGIDPPRLSAELLLSDVLGLKRIELYTQFDRIVGKDQLERLRRLVERAAQDEPIQYLVGKTEFYSLEMKITPDCMIPRPETELLVERAIEFLRTRTGPQSVCDLCTGCGCIAVAVAKNYPSAGIIATDICDRALAVAAHNIEKHGLQNRIRLLHGDLFDPVVPQLDVAKFDLIVCNPPYVSDAEFEKLEKNVKDYEPRLALFGGEDGLDVYRRIAEKVDRFLKNGAAMMLEIGYAQGQAVRQFLEGTRLFSKIKVEKDLHNNDRVITAIRTSS